MRPSAFARTSRCATIIAAATVPILLATPAGAAPNTEWTDTDPPILDQDYWFEAVDPRAPDDAWTAGIAYGELLDDGVIAHWDGQQWSHDILKGIPQYDVDVLSESDVWTSGFDHNTGDGVVVHGGSGSEWTVTPLVGGEIVQGIEAVAADEVWAAAGDGRIYRFDGKEWTEQDVPLPDGATSSFLNAITATPDGHVWAAGSVHLSDGTTQAWMPRFDGETWTNTPVPAAGQGTVGVFDIAADAVGVWAGGLHKKPTGDDDGPLLMRWDGDQWIDVDTGVTDGIIEGVTPDGSGGALAVGYDNRYQPLLLRYRDGEVTVEKSPVQGDVVRLMDTAIEPDGGNVWVTGDHKTPEFVKGLGVYAPAAGFSR